MDILKQQLQGGDYNIEDSSTSPHNVSGLLKEWLKNMPTPIIPYNL